MEKLEKRNFNLTLQVTKNLVLLLYILTFGLAFLDKIRNGIGLPEWFVKQFAGSFLDLFPGSLGFSYALIATLEALVVIVLIGGMLRQSEVTKQLGLVLSCLVFTILGFGQRLTGQYEGAFQLFVYAMVSAIYILTLGSAKLS